MVKKIIAFLIFSLIQFSSIALNVEKTITFTSIDIPAGSCYINADGDPEDPAIVIDCASGSRLFSAEWAVDIPSSGNYVLPTAWGACSFGSSFVLDPINNLVVTTLNVTIQTMEGDDIDCDNDAGAAGVDDCINSSTFLLDITAGSHSFTVGPITYNYTVTEVFSLSNGFTCGLALPIELLDFNATVINKNEVHINWLTTSENNIDFFVIERSNNSLDWEKFKRIDVKKNPSETFVYSEIDESPYFGISYYRLKQTNIKGENSFSEIKSITLKETINSELNIYPNPTKNQITIEGIQDESSEIRVYSILGQDVTSLIRFIKKTNYRTVINLSGLENGIYFIKIGAETGTIQKR